MFVVEGGLMLAPWKRKEPSDGRLSGVNREASNRGRNRSAKSRNWTTPKLTGRS
jgi:hypothetical protein